MEKENTTLIRVTVETYKKLMKMKGILIAKDSQPKSFDDVISYLLDKYFEGGEHE